MSFSTGDIVEVRVFSTKGDQTAINVRHYRASLTVGTGSTEQQFADERATVLGPLFKPLMSASSSWRGVGVRKIWPLPVAIETYSIIGQASGSSAGDPLPSQTCGLVSLRSALAGRANRARLYVPFPAEQDSGAAGTPVAGYLVNLTNLGIQLIAPTASGAGGNTTNWIPVVYHRQFHTSTDFASFQVPSKWATQRRRGSFGRPNTSPI